MVQPLLRELTVDRSIAVIPPNQENTTMKPIDASKPTCRVVSAERLEQHLVARAGDFLCSEPEMLPLAKLAAQHGIDFQSVPPS